MTGRRSPRRVALVLDLDRDLARVVGDLGRSSSGSRVDVAERDLRPARARAVADLGLVAADPGQQRRRSRSGRGTSSPSLSGMKLPAGRSWRLDCSSARAPASISGTASWAQSTSLA